jgi:hypothetical protein
MNKTVIVKGWRCHVCGTGFEREYQLEDHKTANAIDHCRTELATNFLIPVKTILEYWSSFAGKSVAELKRILHPEGGY